MMKTRVIIFSILGLLFCGIEAFSQGINQLTIPATDGKLGQEVSIPVYLTNDDEITGVQVNIHFPQGAQVNINSITLSDRKENHTISVRSVGNDNYLFLIFSANNRLIKGNSGILFTVPVTIPMDWEEGSSYPLSFNQVILTSVQGDNLATESDPGFIRIITEPRPDVAVQNIQTNKNNISPGDNLNISWSVKNVGDKVTEGGWHEQLFLMDDNGTQTFLATVYYAGVLTAENSVTRQTEVVLPQLPGIDGNVKVQVRVIPDADLGELPSAQSNNISQSDQYLTVSKKLIMELPQYVIPENNSSLIQCKLSRSGYWTEQQIFTLSTNDSQRISLPASVTIPAQQSGVFFYITVIDNTILDIDSLVSIVAEGNGYEAVNGEITIDDNELASLSLSISKQELNEGDIVTLTIERERIASSDLLVYLTCNHSKRFEIPVQVIIPAGEKSVRTSVTAIDDNIPDVLMDVEFTATASKHQSAKLAITLNDNDVPDIELIISPETVNESAGYLAVNAVLRRLTNKESNITVKLSDNSNGNLDYPSQLALAPGVEEVRFTIGVIDNANADGDRTIDITAAVYISSCSCAVSGTNAGVVHAALTILDDDGPALKITSSQTMLQEGKTDAAILTVTRNTLTTQPLIVTISSDRDGELNYEKIVTIPAGSVSVQVPVSVTSNDITEGDRTVVFTVTADGFTKGICWVMITDQTLPDAVISEITLSASELQAEEKVDLRIIVSNTGAASLATPVLVNIYLSNSANVFAECYTQKDLAINASDTIFQSLTLPDATGDYTLYAVVNENQAVKELLYMNNKSETLSVKLLPKFTAAATTDKTIYKQGEAVIISGQVTGNQINNVPVEVYVINSGIRQTLNATTDASGYFQLIFQPSVYQFGHFSLGACYPKEGLTTEQASFDIYGIKQVNSAYITHDVIVNEPTQSNIRLINTGTLPLNNVRAEIVSVPENCQIIFEPINSMEGSQTENLNYTLTGNAASEGSDWQQIKVRIIGDESDLLELTLYCYFRSATGKLEASISSINTTMTKGVFRDYPFTITNMGKGATGKISLSLPANASWLSTATPKEMASLAPNESTTVILRFTPTENLALNVPITGTIGINCENGSGLPLAFSIEPVSESTGTLIVDVCDEYTYYTAEAPHLQGAKVVLKHPVTNVVIAEGTTDAAGLFTVNDLPEGYYAIEVSAEKHDRYQNNILIDPGKENKKVVNLSFQAITYSWEVIETEVEDKYEIVTTVNYETNVPVPVVEVIFPETLEYEDQIFSILATNKGLIAAQNVRISLPELDGLDFEVLTQNQDQSLAPQQSVVFYVKMTTKAQTQLRIAGPHHIIGCIAGAIGLYYTWYCGLEEKLGSAMANYAWGECSSIFPWFSGGGGSCSDCSPGTPGGPSGNGNVTPSVNNNYPTIVRDCSDCEDKFKKKFVDCTVGSIPVLGCLLSAADCVGGWISSSNKARVWCIAGSIAGCLNIDDGGLFCIVGLLDPCDRLLESPSNKSQRLMTQQKSLPPYITEFQEKLYYIYSELLVISKIKEEIFGNKIWIENTKADELNLFYNVFLSLNPIEEVITYEELYPYKPHNISNELLILFIERWNNTRLILNEQSVENENYVYIDRLDEYMLKVREYEEKAVEYGYSSMSNLLLKEFETMKEKVDEPSDAVCATISLQFSQTMTMTRQAFRGTLTVFNGHENTAMQDVKLNLIVKDAQGNIATSHEFQINNENLQEFGGELNGLWSLDAQKTGVATVVFIPTKYAAPTEPLDYSFGGTLSYIDPFTGLEVTRNLFPVTLTVKPSPNLELTYFMQRDILGDDPLTTDVIEPKVPAEFSLLIHNVGVGDATNLKMVTQQPKIVDNQKGLFIDFELLSSQLNGGDHTLALGSSVATEFGNIEGGKTAYAQWWFTGSLLGHFTDYDIEATHITSYGNPDLTLLDKVTIHELIHSIRVPDDGDLFLTGFLVNDIIDSEDLPDRIYFSDGTIYPVTHAVDVNVSPDVDNRYTLTVVPFADGWNYGAVNDPVNGRQKLIEVRRLSDNTLIDLRNFWQTDRTLRDGKDPLRENKLHFVDKLATGSEQYILTFTPRPDIFLEVDVFEGVPSTLSPTPVTEVKVCFNKNIVASTFTSDDIRLTCQGNSVDVGLIAITPVDEKEFTLDLSAVTQSDGYYVLTVQTAAITDNEGYTGEAGKTADWNQYLGGKVQFNLKIEPEAGGTATPLSGKYDYGSILNLEAVPNETYVFDKWTMGVETLSTETTYSFTLLSERMLTATFKLKLYDVTINYDSNTGNIVGGGTGKYEYGTQLILRAEASSGYIFKSWIVNGESIETNNTLDITILSDVIIEGLFEPLSNVAPENLLLSNNTFLMNSSVGTIVGAFTTVDSNEQDTDFTYQLVTGEGDTHNDLFEIYGDELSVNADFNCVKDTVYTVRVRTTDEGDLWFEKAFELNMIPTHSVEDTTRVSHAVCSGESYDFFGTTLTTSGEYSHTLQNVYGCDSTVVLTLTVLPEVVVDLGDDLTVENYEPVVLDAGAGFASYLWSTGAATQQITVENTEKADTITVWVNVATIDNCADSDTIQIVYLKPDGLLNPVEDGFVKVYPNPTTGKINLLFAYPEQRVITVYDLKGSLLYVNEFNEASIELDLNHLESGVYIMKINYRREVKVIILKS